MFFFVAQHDSVETQSFCNCVLSTFRQCCSSFALICNRNPALEHDFFSFYGVSYDASHKKNVVFSLII